MIGTDTAPKPRTLTSQLSGPRRNHQTHLKPAEQVVQLLGREVPGQLSQQVVHVFDDGLVFARLRGPQRVEVLQRQGLLLYYKPDNTHI